MKVVGGGLEENSYIKEEKSPGKGRPKKAEHLSMGESAEGFAELSNAVLVSTGLEEEFQADDWKKFGKAVAEVLNQLGETGGVGALISRVLIYTIRFAVGIAEGIKNIRRIIIRIRTFRQRRQLEEPAELVEQAGEVSDGSY